MPLLGATSETTIHIDMQSRSEYIDLPVNSSTEDSYDNSDDNSQQSQNTSISTVDSSPPFSDRTPSFDPFTCLFCSRTHTSLAQNLSHMSTSHSFHVQTASLLVEPTTLLAHFHSIITDFRECLYCRKRLRSSEAVRQHMVCKGHCMYDIAAGGDAEIKGLYGFEGVKADLTARLDGLRVPRHELAASIRRDRKKRDAVLRSAEASMRNSESRDFDSDGGPCFNDGGDDVDAHLDTDPDTDRSSHTSQQQLITPPHPQSRSQQQTSTFECRLTQLRESDRRSIQNLPTSQQRALLATQFKQAEKDGRAASARRGALESAGNSFGRLSSVRLVRMPPHTGRVQSLKH
jgi:pre-60S factor REI1